MAAKVKSKSTANAPATTKKLTLADLTVSWHGREGATRIANGATLAWLLDRAGHLTGATEVGTYGAASGLGPSLLRGLGALVAPDAGSAPIDEIEGDKRSFLDWVLGEIAAQLHADELGDVENAKRFSVTIGS